MGFSGFCFGVVEWGGRLTKFSWDGEEGGEGLVDAMFGLFG